MLIDLDATPLPRPGRHPQRKPWKAALALSLVLLLVGSSAVRADGYGPLTTVAGTDQRASSWLLTTDLLVSAQVVAGNVQVTARTLDGGGVAWSRWIEGDGAAPVLAEHGPYLIVTFSGVVTLVLDRGTGRVRWEPEGYQFAFAAGDRIAVWEDGRLGLLDLGARRMVWWQPFATRVVAAAATGRYLIVVDEDGVAHARVVRTGAPVSDTFERTGDAFVRVTVDDSRLYALGAGSVTALRLPDLTELWTVPRAAPSHLTRCGSQICVATTAGLTAIDPFTGAVRWSDIRRTAWTDDGLATTADGRVVMLDPDTGRELAEVGRGFPAGDLLLRGDEDRTWVADWQSGEIRGLIPGATQVVCERAGDHLACQGPDGRVRAWRIPRGSPRE
ncbi:PQQ-binding-like beta-propeller repeat protein [Actinoplanes sp. NPDC024001]|uniref:outer membrane protein assembly factor BamB family protein n=1 Tax=Actinoplanes sp. NPDC024001 TaxID=3154598 RepID=UPI00340A757B